MTRTEGDTWDLGRSVGATATMVAAARAAATRRGQPIINDPFAEPLVRAVGLDVFTRIAVGELDANEAEGFPRMIDTFAARARFYDDYLTEATGAGIRQVVIVAAGLDSRAYRLAWPAGTTVYEIDQPEVIEFKTSTLSKIGAEPTTEHRTVGIDLRDDWPAALQAAGLDPTKPTAWLAEGVLIGFLPPEAEVRLLDSVDSLSVEGSRLAADYGTVVAPAEQAQQLAQFWRRHGLELDISSLAYPGEHTDVAAHLEAHGWDATRSNLGELFTAAGLPELQKADQQRPPAATIGYVRAHKE
jgi:methyltransferase (TIGR00027 family)